MTKFSPQDEAWVKKMINEAMEDYVSKLQDIAKEILIDYTAKSEGKSENARNALGVSLMYNIAEESVRHGVSDLVVYHSDIDGLEDPAEIATTVSEIVGNVVCEAMDDYVEGKNEEALRDAPPAGEA